MPILARRMTPLPARSYFDLFAAKRRKKCKKAGSKTRVLMLLFAPFALSCGQPKLKSDPTKTEESGQGL
jgi:hypothetical protein